jgi:hypothetical protein
MESTLHIGQLSVRVAGESFKTGQRLAESIAEKLAWRLPAGLRRRLGALDLRVHLPDGATEAEMSDAIAEAILRALEK